ncbi:MAG: hypothetical protein K8I82_19885 [Anaerolineae bacterium]|nr:hypothetical protein [Anaerolineae bacterium]
MTVIRPEYKLILTYDIRAEYQAQYNQFMLGEFIPGLQTLGLYITGVYHTLHGDYPARLAEFVTEGKDIMQKSLESEQFTSLEDRLKKYTQNYTRKVVKFRNGFQF